VTINTPDIPTKKKRYYKRLLSERSSTLANRISRKLRKKAEHQEGGGNKQKETRIKDETDRFWKRNRKIV